MALKPDRVELATELAFHMNEVAERGGVVTMLTAGAGGAWITHMGSKDNVVTYAADPTAKVPIGILLNDQVARQAATGLTLSAGMKDEMPVGGKCTILTRGWCETNRISGTPVGGENAYLGANGLVATTGTVKIGIFLSKLDADGFARVYVDI